MWEGVNRKVFWCTRRCWVFHRQSSTYGDRSTLPGSLQAARVATSGSTSVVEPELVLAGEPANRSAFSHAITAVQLSTNLLWATSNVSPYAAPARGSLP